MQDSSVTNENITRFVKLLKDWTNPSEDDEGCSDITYNQLLALLAQLETTARKSVLVLECMEKEALKDGRLYAEYTRRMCDLRRELVTTSTRYKMSKILKSRHIEVDIIKNVVTIYPPVHTLKREIKDMKHCIKDLEIKQKMLTRKMNNVKKEYQVIEDLIAYSYQILSEPQLD